MSLLKNSTIVITGGVISNLLAYIFHFLAGRLLGPAEYGVFGALMALFLQVAIPATALSSGITKFTSRYKLEDKLENIASLRKKIQYDLLIFFSIVLGLIIFFSQSIAAFLNVNSNILIILVSACIAFYLLLSVNRGILQGMKKFQVLSWNSIIEAFARLVLLIIFFYLKEGVNGALMAYGLAYLVAFLCVFPYIKETREKFTGKGEIKIKPVYKFIFLVLVVNFLIQSILNLPSLFIKHFYSSEFTGYWTAALNISRISIFVTSSISVVMFPEISAISDNASKRKIFGKAALLVLLASSSISLLFFVAPQLFIRILYGQKFLGAVPVLQWMGFAMIFIGLLQLWFDYRLASRR